MAKAKNANKETFKDFLNYCKALDFCKVLTRLRNLDVIGHKCDEGYNPVTEKWFIECTKVTCYFHQMRKWVIWLKGHFEYNECIHTWFFEAADVTHVTSNLSDYENILSSRAIERVQHNEPLYALKYAPLLSLKWTTSGVLQALEQDSDDIRYQTIFLAGPLMVTVRCGLSIMTTPSIQQKHQSG